VSSGPALRVALLHDVIRPEEKLLVDRFRRERAGTERAVELVLVDAREIAFVPGADPGCDAVLCRAVSYSRGLYARHLFESAGVRAFNGARVAEICGDKLLTSLALQKASIPQPEFRVALDESTALRTMEDMGFPLVLKPVIGSWGRLVARADDRDQAESLLEHRAALPSYQHHIYYIQRYVDKGGSDLRVFVVGGRPIAAIRRWSENWRTNTHRGGRAEGLRMTAELREICVEAAEAVGGGMLALDVFENDGRYLVNEVNDTMEFRNSIETTGVDIPGAMVDYVLSQLTAEAPCRRLAS
jgi:[lysine-biosynthesis-protein LysW]---L-2-aminoadipate ligase